jgi:hypothetical protein
MLALYMTAGLTIVAGAVIAAIYGIMALLGMGSDWLKRNEHEDGES